MREWCMAGEPSLDELLGDEIMDRMMRAAGLDAREMRRQLAEIARRWRERVASNRRGGSGRATFG
ncbi:MAG TPA: hypothetical protein VFA22_10965 [Stellaceae bacterium]|nr:hypothetical protein [Stellaceae bacterium]